jgi:molybdate transport system substrate-binding protein
MTIRICAALAAALLAMPPAAGAAEIKVLVTTAMKTAMDELAAAFERATPHKVTITYGPSGALAKRIADGEAADLVVFAGGVDELIDRKKIVPAGRTDIARAKIGVSVRKGAPKPDIATSGAFRHALLTAKSVAFADPASGGASGVYLVKMIERLGIAAEVKAKARLARGGPDGMVSAIVAKGDAEIGLQQISEIMSVAGVDLVGPLPDELQTVTTYVAGVPATASQPDLAVAFVRFLTTPDAAAIYRAKGLEPG